MITLAEHMRVAWVDTDASGLIHYTAALRYFEVAEHALLRTLFADWPPGPRTFGLPRVHVEADYKAALHYPDEFTCSARVAAVGRGSVTFAYEVRRARRDPGVRRGALGGGGRASGRLARGRVVQ